MISSVFFIVVPGIDVRISHVFFHDGFLLTEQGWSGLLHEGLGYVLALSLLSVLGIYAFNRIRKRNVLEIRGRTVCYLFLVLILGAGLIVNVIFKDHFGRARPLDIEEFGGSKRFTPAFVISGECDRNCSFSSGDGAGGFFALALAQVLSRRRGLSVAGVAFGSVVSLARIATGAHFFSDSVVSFFVMLIVADVLFYYMILPVTARMRADGPAG